jgi:hypothetical protein
MLIHDPLIHDPLISGRLVPVHDRLVSFGRRALCLPGFEPRPGRGAGPHSKMVLHATMSA